MNSSQHDPLGWHGTTILCVRKDGRVAMAGDGQVSIGQTVVKGNARKVRRIANGKARRVLGWRPRYNDYKAGLAAIAAAEKIRS